MADRATAGAARRAARRAAPHIAGSGEICEAGPPAPRRARGPRAFQRLAPGTMLRSASAAARHALQLASAQLRSERALRHCDAAAHRALTPAWRHGGHARASTEAALADEVFISDACAKVRSQRRASCGATTARPADAPRRCHAPQRAAAARADARGARPRGQRLRRRRACCCRRAAQRNRAARGGGGRRLLRLPVPLPAGRAGACAGRQARSSPAQGHAPRWARAWALTHTLLLQSV